MKKFFSVVFFVASATILFAQNSDWVIKSGPKGNYIEHKVGAKENFYSLGRAYNVHPKHLAAFNSMDMSKGLSLGQMIKIPLTDTNFSQKKETDAPVYYVVGDKEGLYRVSVNNKVLMENLRKWNHLTSDNISPGKKLIVGFFVSTDLKNVAVTPPKKEEESKKEIKNEVVKTEPPKKEEKEMEYVKKPDENKEKQEMKNEEQGAGYFKISFTQQIKQQPVSKDETVTAGIFKTASGWSDAKYYLLMDSVEPGTVVKIINPANNKIIYAKVLGQMNKLRQDEGLNIRISNAAATALAVEETDKFIVKLNY